jgi:uncharacterized repeat protein (TIGR03803 family)
MQNKKTTLSCLFSVFLVLPGLLAGARPSIAADNEKVLHSFCYDTFTCSDAAYPYAGLIFDRNGNLYGTTTNGGSYDNGAVFELSSGTDGKWAERVLHSFGDGKDGYSPFAGLIFDNSGNLYGTTGARVNGKSNGTIFELSPNSDDKWTERVLHNFVNDKDGMFPDASLVFDKAGNLYGTTSQGGQYSLFGTVFELSPSSGGKWAERILHNFNNNGRDGYQPLAGLIVDASGNLYGETSQGGSGTGCSCGTVFELSPGKNGVWTEKVLHNFNNNGKDGFYPYQGLILDVSGNLYGTTYQGGTHRNGTVFELSPGAHGRWTEHVLHSFDGNDGANPAAGLSLDAAGNLYGTTQSGGTYSEGTVFELSPGTNGKWMERVLHSFSNNGKDGTWPEAAVIFDSSGNLYGTTRTGGAYGNGTVFEIVGASRPSF